MRVKELESVEELIDIKEDETILWKLDYEITEHYKRVNDEEGFFDHVEYPYYTVKIFSENLLNELNENLNLKYILNEEIKVTKDIASDIREYVRGLKYSGLIGSKDISEE